MKLNFKCQKISSFIENNIDFWQNISLDLNIICPQKSLGLCLIPSDNTRKIPWEILFFKKLELISFNSFYLSWAVDVTPRPHYPNNWPSPLRLSFTSRKKTKHFFQLKYFYKFTFFCSMRFCIKPIFLMWSLLIPLKKEIFFAENY